MVAAQFISLNHKNKWRQLSLFIQSIGINGGNRSVYSLNFLGPFTNQPTRIHPHPQGINIQIIKIPHMIQHINPLNYVHPPEPVKIWQSTEKCPTPPPSHMHTTEEYSSQFMHTKPLFGLINCGQTKLCRYNNYLT